MKQIKIHARPINNGPKIKSHYNDHVLKDHNLWAVFCEDKTDEEEFVRLDAFMYEIHEFLPFAHVSTKNKEIIRWDFIVLYNMDDETVSYIGRVADIKFDPNHVVYKYSCTIEWAEIDTKDVDIPIDEYTENPVLLTGNLFTKWEKVINEQVVK